MCCAGTARGGVHADDLARGVGQRAAGVAGLNLRAGLQHAVQGLGRPAALVPGHDRPVGGVDDARRDGGVTALAARVTDGQDRGAQRDLGGVAHRDRLQARRVLQLEQRHVLGGVIADDPRRVGLARGDLGGLDRGGAVDHVIVGEHETIGVEHHPGAFRRLALVVQRGRDVDDPRLHLGRDRGGVEAGPCCRCYCRCSAGPGRRWRRHRSSRRCRCSAPPRYRPRPPRPARRPPGGPPGHGACAAAARRSRLPGCPSRRTRRPGIRIRRTRIRPAGRSRRTGRNHRAGRSSRPGHSSLADRTRRPGRSSRPGRISRAGRSSLAGRTAAWPYSAGLAVAPGLAVAAGLLAVRAGSAGLLPVAAIAVAGGGQRPGPAGPLLAGRVRRWLVLPAEGHCVAASGVAEGPGVVRTLPGRGSAGGRRDLRAHVLRRLLCPARPVLATALVFLHHYRPCVETG